MAEETNQPVREVSEQEIPPEETPEAASGQEAAPAPEEAPVSGAARVVAAAAARTPAAPHAPRKGGTLLAFLVALLILVGIVDAILWGVAGYYLLQSSGNETDGAQAQTTSVVEAPADS